jgi:crotonobetainyl-CoA:carnitine CoA-transferase CaiB-like acyl-CoA transferase
MTARPLEGIAVVDSSVGMAGGSAAMLLADFGADVVRVTPMDPADPGERVWARGKRIAEVDGAALEELLARADVHVSSALDADAGRPAHERLVQLLTPPFLGSHTPWAGGAESDPLLAAVAGVSLRQASVEGGPVESVYRHLLTVQGVWAAACAVAALVERESSGLGQRVTVGGLHGAMIAAAAGFSFDADAPDPAPDAPRPGGGGGAVPFYRTYQCGDGEWLFLAALTPRFTTIAFEVLGVPDLLEDPRLEGKGRAGVLLPEHSTWAIETLAGIFRTRPRDEWLSLLGAAGCPAGALLDRDDWLDHPQLAAIGMRVEAGGVVMPGNPIHLDSRGVDEAAWPAPGAPANSRHGSGAGTIGAANPGRGPLAGVRVLDLGAIIAGPFSASLLAELGADVIKIEPLGGDSFRGPGFAAYNKGQRGIALDLQHPDGRDAFLDLARGADLVVDNYRPGVLGRLRLRHEDLVAVNPSISTLSVTGFGEGGPLGEEPGFDPVLQAMSGMMDAQGGDGDPVFFTVPVNDVTTAAEGALAGAVALFHRARTGAGSRMWTSLAGTSALLQAGELVRYPGRPSARRGGRDFRGPGDDDRYHPCADGWVRVAGAPFDATWLTMTRAEVVAALTQAGIAAAPALRARELVHQPGIAEAEVLHADPRPKRESWFTAGRHASFSRTPREGTLVSPSLGEHTREVLLEAGFDGTRVEALVSNGIAGAR